MSWFDRLLYFVFFPIVCLGSILSPLTNDVRIFYGIEQLGIKYLPFPQSVYGGYWEIKPVANHICQFLIASFTNIFVPFSNHALQEPIIKSIAIAMAIFACYIFSKNILKVKYSFLLCFCGMFCALNLVVLQAEFLAIIFAMISCALFVEKNKLWHYVAGALLIWVLLVKGTTGALIISAVCIVLIFNNQRIDWVRGLVGFITMGGAFYAASLTIWQQMIPDILMAPILSHVGEYDWFGQIGVTAIATTISASIYIPCIGLGIVYGGAWLKNHIRDPRAKWFVLSFLAPLFIVFYQSESFAYQYYVFLLPAVVGLVLYEVDTPIQKPGKKLKRENIVAMSVVLLFLMWCILYSPQPIWGLEQNYGVQELKMNNFFDKNANEMEVKFNLSKEKTLLYLDTGSGPYYTNGVNSSCRYVAPLILQRNNPGRTVVSNLTEYWDAYNCTMDYNERYILADGPLGKDDGWFGTDSPEKKNIVSKVKSEYNEVFSGAWTVYEKKK